MKEFIEKLIGRLEEKVVNRTFDESIKTKNLAYKEAIEIVNQLEEEYKGGWTPCSRELPPQPEENPAFDNRTLEIYLVSDSISDYPYRAFWNGKYWTDGFSDVEVIAWQPLPAPYQPKGE